MSQAGLLLLDRVGFDDDWIEIDAPAEEAVVASPVLAAIAAAQASIQRGENASVRIDLDELADLDELDDAAIRAFFAETD